MASPRPLSIPLPGIAGLPTTADPGIIALAAETAIGSSGNRKTAIVSRSREDQAGIPANDDSGVSANDDTGVPGATTADVGCVQMQYRDRGRKMLA